MSHRESYEPQNREMGYVFLNGSGAVTDLGHPKMALFGKEKDDQPLDSLVFLGPLTYSANDDLTLW